MSREVLSPQLLKGELTVDELLRGVVLLNKSNREKFLARLAALGYIPSVDETGKGPAAPTKRLTPTTVKGGLDLSSGEYTILSRPPIKAGPVPETPLFHKEDGSVWTANGRQVMVSADGFLLTYQIPKGKKKGETVYRLLPLPSRKKTGKKNPAPPRSGKPKFEAITEKHLRRKDAFVGGETKQVQRVVGPAPSDETKSDNSQQDLVKKSKLTFSHHIGGVGDVPIGTYPALHMSSRAYRPTGRAIHWGETYSADLRKCLRPWGKDVPLTKVDDKEFEALTQEFTGYIVAKHKLDSYLFYRSWFRVQNPAYGMRGEPAEITVDSKGREVHPLSDKALFELITDVKQASVSYQKYRGTVNKRYKASRRSQPYGTGSYVTPARVLKPSGAQVTRIPHTELETLRRLQREERWFSEYGIPSTPPSESEPYQYNDAVSEIRSDVDQQSRCQPDWDKFSIKYDGELKLVPRGDTHVDE